MCLEDSSEESASSTEDNSRDVRYPSKPTARTNQASSAKARRAKKKRVDIESSTTELSDTDIEEEPANLASSNWSLLNSIWPVSDRPANLQREEVVNQIEFSNLLNMAKYHKELSQSSTSGTSKASFTKDTLPGTTVFKEAKDDGIRKLHPARFLRMPLSNPKKWWHKVPVSRGFKYRAIPLKFSGCQGQVSERTIENAHDRANCHQLKHFHSENITVSSKPFKKIERKDDDGLSTITDYLWEDPATMSQVQDAILNYQAVQQQIWPLDVTPTIILKTLTKYKWVQSADNLKDKVAVATSFFNGVMRENAGRAVRNETIMDFPEQETLMKDTLTAHGISCAVPIARIPKLEPGQYNKKMVEQRPQPRNFNKKPDRSNKFQVAKVNGLGVCYGFNENVCKNPVQLGKSCKDAQNREFAHFCNKWVHANEAHCLKPHPRHKHV